MSEATLEQEEVEIRNFTSSPRTIHVPAGSTMEQVLEIIGTPVSADVRLNGAKVQLNTPVKQNDSIAILVPADNG